MIHPGLDFFIVIGASPLLSDGLGWASLEHNILPGPKEAARAAKSKSWESSAAAAAAAATAADAAAVVLLDVWPMHAFLFFMAFFPGVASARHGMAWHRPPSKQQSSSSSSSWARTGSELGLGPAALSDCGIVRKHSNRPISVDAPLARVVKKDDGSGSSTLLGYY